MRTQAFFEPELLAELSVVLESAWAEAQRDALEHDGMSRPPAIRSKVALQILEAAADGERDMTRLRALADAGFSAR